MLAPLVIGVVLLTLIGLVTVFDGLLNLRFAHTYRQRTNEGLGFVAVGSELLMGGGLSALGASGLVVVSLLVKGRSRGIALMAAGLVTFFLGAAGAFALWVFDHGTSCIGPCGG